MAYGNANVDDVIGKAIGTPGRAKATKPVKRVVARPPTQREIPEEDPDESEISRIKREVKREYERDLTTTSPEDRILGAIEYLRINYPGVLLPMALLHWMCSPGPNILSSTHNEVLFFAKRVARYRGKMLLKYRTSFYRSGHSKMNAGFFRAYISQQELATYEMGKAGNNLKKAFGKAEALAAAVGNVNSLKTDEVFTAERKEEARDFVKILSSIGQSIKGYLPAPAPKPPALKVIPE